MDKKKEISIVACAVMTMGISMDKGRKKKRRIWQKRWLADREKYSHMSLLRELRGNNPDDLRNYLRMDENLFDELLTLMRHSLSKQDTRMRQSIPADERLIATLRFRVTGRSYEDLKFITGISALWDSSYPKRARRCTTYCMYYLKMTEVNYILTTMTSRSLVIIDELCRSTSIEEGTAIAMVICEHLARSGAYTYVTTHFPLLAKLADLFVNIKIWQMQTIPSGDPNNPKTMKLDYKFNLVPGTIALRGYGIYMARNIWPAEALRHVDELQGQLTKSNNDPKFPSIDKRVRLKYDLECKLKKLKLQKKLTIANLNKHMNDYNNEMASLGEALHNSQIMLPDLLTTSVESDGLNHSIFNASKNNTYARPESEISKIRLTDIEENNGQFYNVSQSELSSIHFEEELNNSEKVVFSPLSTQDSFKSPISSPSKAKRRLQEIFTPDTNLENSIASNQYFGLFAPEVNLSYNASECSLNLTRNALDIEEDHHSPIGNNAEDQQIQDNHNDSFYKAQNEASSDHEHSRNIFKGSQNINNPIVSYGSSQVSSCDLSQKLKMIREQRRNLTFTKSPSEPKLLSDLSHNNSAIESPFISTFVRPLQSDITRTSTPLITKIKHNARNFESSSTSSRPTVQNRTAATTPKINFTILSRVDDVDMQSVQEDLESFVEDLQNEEFSPEEDTTSPGGQNSDNLPGIIREDYTNKKPEEINNVVHTSTIFRTVDSGQEYTAKNVEKYKNLHIFPIVKIIEGPNNPSSEEDASCLTLDKETLVKPIVRNPQPQANNQEKEDALVRAFNSLSEPKNVVSLQKTDCNIDSTLNNGNSNYDVQHWNSPSNNTILEERDNKEKNVDVLVEAFNSLSNPRNNSIANDKKANNFRTGNDVHLSENNATKASNYKNIDQVISSDDIFEPTENLDDLQGVKNQENNIFEEIEEPSMDCYESALSSQGLGSTPPTLPKKGPSNDSNQLTVKSRSSSEESVFHIVNDCEAQLEDEINQHKIVPKEKMDTESVEEVGELSDKAQVYIKKHCGKENDMDIHGHSNDANTIILTSNDRSLSNIYKPVPNPNSQETVTDYEKSTEKFPVSGHNSIKKNLSESNYDTASPQETKCSNKRKSNFYSDISAGSASLPSLTTSCAIKNQASTTRREHSDAQKNKKWKKRKSDVSATLSAESDSQGAQTPMNDLDSKSECAERLKEKRCIKNAKLKTSRKFLLKFNNKSNNKNSSNTPAKSKKLKAKTSKTRGLQESNSSNKLSAEFNNILSHGDTTSPIQKVAIKSITMNAGEHSNDSASSTYVSVTDVIQTVDEETLNLRNYKFHECEEAVQKEKELMEKVRHLKDTLNVKDIINEFGQTKHIPLSPNMSVYGSCSSFTNCDKENKALSKDFFMVDLKSNTTVQTRKSYSRKPTLGIARYKHGSKNLKYGKLSKKSSSSNETISKEDVRPKEVTQSMDIELDKNIEVKNAGSETDVAGSEKSKLEKINRSNKIKPITLVKSTSRKGLKKRKLSSNESTSLLAHSPQNRITDEKTITSISEASKLRNLDGDISSNSSGAKKYGFENIHCNLGDCEGRSSDGHQEKTVTTISDASRKRNLDQSTNSSSDKRNENDTQKAADQTSFNVILPESSNQNQPKKRNSKRAQKRTEETTVEQITNSFISEASSSSRIETATSQDQSKLKFISPLKLSKKAIQEAFYEQDKRFFENSGSSTELAKMWEQRLRRPSVRQIQRSTCLATLRKTEEGVEIIPEKEKTKRKNSKKERILSSSSSSVNMNIFSDKNAKTFDMFIKSDKKDFKSFNFNFRYGEASMSRNDGKMFNLNQVNSAALGCSQNRNRLEEFPLMGQINSVSSGYNQNWKRSETFLSSSQQSRSILPLLTQNPDFSLTPEGFYKQNKDDINQLLQKYNN